MRAGASVDFGTAVVVTIAVTVSVSVTVSYIVVVGAGTSGTVVVTVCVAVTVSRAVTVLVLARKDTSSSPGAITAPNDVENSSRTAPIYINCVMIIIIIIPAHLYKNTVTSFNHRKKDQYRRDTS